MQTFIDAALSYKRAVLALLAFLCALGALSYVTIHKEANPDVPIPIMIVSVTHAGISAEDAEYLLLKPLEQELKTLSGLKEISGYASQGRVSVVLEFLPGFDPKAAHFNVREKVDLARAKFPADTDEPELREINVSLFPILVVQLYGDVPEMVLGDVAHDLEEEIQRKVPSVLRVDLVGDRDEILEVLIKPERLIHYGIQIDRVMALFEGHHQLASAGTISNDGAAFSLKIQGLVRSPEEMMTLPVVAEDGRVVLFRDIGEVRQTLRGADTYSRYQGKPSIALEIVKRTGTNIIETVQSVKAVVAAAEATWPKGVHAAMTRDESETVQDMLGDLEESLVLASILVFLMLLLTLEFRLAVLVAIAVPGCFLITMTILDMMGVTLNIVVLFSLIFAVGMLVDGAIIVVEYAERQMQEGATPLAAFRSGALRMAWPVISSTVTILVVFLPLLFWPGVIGKFMKFLPMTLIIILSVSLVMALVFIPALGSVIYPKRPHEEGKIPRGPSVGSRVYIFLLDWCLHRPWRVILASIAVVLFVFWGYGTFGPGVHFFAEVEPDNAMIFVRARGNLSLDEQDRLVKAIEDDVRAMPYLLGVSASVGVGAGETSNEGDEAPKDTIGRIALEFVPWRERPPAEMILEDIRQRFKDIRGVALEIRAEQGGPNSGKPIEMVVAGRDLDALKIATEQILTQLETVPGVRDIESTLPLPGLEMHFDMDRKKAAALGVALPHVAGHLQMLTHGVKLGTYRADGRTREADVILRLPKSGRRIEEILPLRVGSNNGLVPLAEFVTTAWAPALQAIERRGGERVYTVKAGVAPGVAASVPVAAMQAWLTQENPLPEGVTVSFKGEQEEQDETAGFLAMSFWIVMGLMFLILLVQFNSFFSALLVLSAVLFAIFGAILGHWVEQSSFGIVMGGVGIVALAGVIVSNNIIMIDTYDHLKETLGETREAILATCRERLRPILLTHVTTILGLLPMMFGINVGFLSHTITVNAPSSQWWVELSATIVYGLFFGSILTLFVTPAALMVRAQFQARRAQKRGKPTH